MQNLSLPLQTLGLLQGRLFGCEEIPRIGVSLLILLTLRVLP